MASHTGKLTDVGKRIGRRYRRARFDRLRSNVQFDPKDAILISANPRGGSTWLFELLRNIPNTATLFEPLHKKWVPEVRALNFDWHQRIPEEADWPEAKQLFDDILSGRLLCVDTGQYSTVDDYKAAERLVIKFIRINGLLPWLTRHFEFALKPVVLTRHPFAMAASMMRHPNWQTMPKHYVFPDGRYSDYSDKDRRFLGALSTTEEAMVAKWCTRNRGFLSHPRHNQDWITLHYETLLLQPEETIRHLFAEWNIDVPPDLIPQIDTASRTSVETDFKRDKAFQLEKWRERFDPDQTARLIAIMDHFEIDLYGDDALPNMASAMAAAQT